MGLKPVEMFYLKAFGVKVSLLFSFIYLFVYFRAAPRAHGSSQARG